MQSVTSNYFSREWKRGPILLGLGFHFSALWGLSSWFWMRCWEWRSAAWRAPIAPLELGISYLQPNGIWTWGVQGLLVTICVVGLTILSAAKRKCWIVLLNHVFVLLYWAYSFLLIGAMV